MNRYEILRGKEPPELPKEESPDAVTSYVKALGGMWGSPDATTTGRRVMGVDVGTGDSSAVVTTVRGDSSGSPLYGTPLLENLVNLDPQTSITVMSQPGSRLRIPNSDNFEEGDIVCADAEGGFRKAEPGYVPVGVAINCPVPISGTIDIQIYSTDQQIQATDQINQAQSGTQIDQRFQALREYQDRLEQAQLMVIRREGEPATAEPRDTTAELEHITPIPVDQELLRDVRVRQSSARDFNRSDFVVPEHQGELHIHPGMQRRLNVPDDHVIVDRNEWERARGRPTNHTSPPRTRSFSGESSDSTSAGIG